MHSDGRSITESLLRRRWRPAIEHFSTIDRDPGLRRASAWPTRTLSWLLRDETDAGVRVAGRRPSRRWRRRHSSAHREMRRQVWRRLTGRIGTGVQTGDALDASIRWRMSITRGSDPVGSEAAAFAEAQKATPRPASDRRGGAHRCCISGPATAKRQHRQRVPPRDSELPVCLHLRGLCYLATRGVTALADLEQAALLSNRALLPRLPGGC